jgi:hypothetical protein
VKVIGLGAKDRMVTTAAVFSVAMVMLSGAAAEARPPTRPGLVTGLSASATIDLGVYTVDATWNASANTTAYKVSMAGAGGVVFSKATVTDTAYSATTTLPATSLVTVAVTPVNGKRPGKSVSTSLNLPDLTAPTASYSVTPQDSADGKISVNLDSVSDDVSAAGQINQEVDFGDGTPTVNAAATTTSFAHDYGPTKALYYPTVTVSDGAGNVSTYDLTAVVADVTPPSGSIAVAPAAAWAKWTKVSVTVSGVSDDLSNPVDVSRTVDWGDGNVTSVVGLSTITHRYRTAGVYEPNVILADQAGNTSAVLTDADVTVTADVVSPKLSLTLPRRHTDRAAAWSTLRGRASDAQSGLRYVHVQAIEKRSRAWFAFNPTKHRWVRAGSTAAAAWKKAGTGKATLGTRHRWSFALKGVTKGTLVFRAVAGDHVGNTSAWKKHSQAIRTN